MRRVAVSLDIQTCCVSGCVKVARRTTGLCRDHEAVRGIVRNPRVNRPRLPAGRFRSGHGHIMLWTEARAPGALPYGDGWAIREHRQVMAESLGRALLSDERVIHRDDNPEHNAIDNLELLVTSRPESSKLSDVLAWARMIVARYAAKPMMHPAQDYTPVLKELDA